MKKYQDAIKRAKKYEEDSHKNNNLTEIGNITLVRFREWESIPGLNHCFTTRHGGVSTGCCDSLNLSFGRESSAENVRENYRRLMRAYGESDQQAVFTNQNHSVKLRRVDEADERYYGPWIFDGEEIDGSVTNRKDITLFTYYGDCVPVYLYDPKNHAAGLMHSGWRGTVNGAGCEAVRKLVEEYGSRPEDLQAVIGPSIGVDCFQVDRDVAEEFLMAFGDSEVVYEDRISEKYLVDLWEANRINLLKAGIPEDHIIISGLCTCCDEKLFFSHRRDKGQTGSMAALMTLK